MFNTVFGILFLLSLQYSLGDDAVGLFLIYRGSTIIARVLLKILNKLGKGDKNARLAEHFISFSQ